MQNCFSFPARRIREDNQAANKGLGIIDFHLSKVKQALSWIFLLAFLNCSMLKLAVLMKRLTPLVYLQAVSVD